MLKILLSFIEINHLFKIKKINSNQINKNILNFNK